MTLRKSFAVFLLARLRAAQIALAAAVVVLGAGAAGMGWAQTAPAAPPIPVEEIIRQFAQHESDFQVERGNYAYTQSVLVEESMGGRRGGRYERVTEVVFTPEGERYERDTYFPPPTLRWLSLSMQDREDLENIQPFVLTTEELPKYDVEYLGQERVDELDTYVFSVSPKRIEKDQRYFQGTIWVDNVDLAIVKSDGKAVPDIVEGGRENRFPRFVTYRENIEGNFWFPTYTRADDTLEFSDGPRRVRMTVRYEDYQRFGSTIRLGPSTTIETPPDDSETEPTSPQP